MSDVRQIITNTLTGWVAIVVRAGIAFAMVPFLLSRLGKDGYGVLGILGVLVGLAQVADLGLRGALGRELTEKVATRDHRGFNELVNTALLLYLGLAMGLVLLVVVLAPWLVVVLNVPAGAGGSAVGLIRYYGAGSILLSFVTPVFSAVLSSYHRFDLINTPQTVISLIFSLLIFVAVLWCPNGLLAWASVMLANQCVLLVVTIYFARRTVSDLRLGWRYRNWQQLRSLFRLGGYMYAFQMTQLLSESSDPLVISFFFGPAGVALYQPGARLSQIARPVVSTLANQLYPLTTRLHVENDQRRMQQVLVLGTKYTLVMGVLAVVVMIACAHPLCRLWLGVALGEDHRIVANVLIGWALADLMAYAAGSQFPVLLGAKRLRFLMWTQVPTAVMNLGLSIYLVGFTRLGIPGVLVATVLIGLIRRPILIWHTAGVCGMRVGDYFMRAYAYPLLLLGILGSAVTVLRLYWEPASWLSLGLFVCGIGVTGAALTWGMVLNAKERRRCWEGVCAIRRGCG